MAELTGDCVCKPQKELQMLKSKRKHAGPLRKLYLVLMLKQYVWRVQLIRVKYWVNKFSVLEVNLFNWVLKVLVHHVCLCMFVLGWGALLRTKCWRIFPEAALSVNSAHTSVPRGCFSSSVVFASQLGDTAHKLKFRLPLVIALVPLFFFFEYFYFLL